MKKEYWQELVEKWEEADTNDDEHELGRGEEEEEKNLGRDKKLRLLYRTLSSKVGLAYKSTLTHMCVVFVYAREKERLSEILHSLSRKVETLEHRITQPTNTSKHEVKTRILNSKNENIDISAHTKAVIVQICDKRAKKRHTLTEVFRSLSPWKYKRKRGLQSRQQPWFRSR
eukprot:jgi/Bigna1/76388/fgenesh1_pg.41_\